MNCLNCKENTTLNYCANCGQKTSTKRFSLSSVLDTVVLSGFFSLHKGVFFTIRELFIRPGHGIREYVKGNRIVHFNAITLLLLLITFSYFLGEFSDVKITDLMDVNGKDFAKNLEVFAKENPRLLYFLNIPILAFSSFIFFRKSKFNFAENLVLAAYIICGQIVLALPFSVLFIFYKKIEVLKSIYPLLSFFSVLYILWCFIQFFSKTYKTRNIVFRSVFAILLYLLLQSIVLIFCLKFKVILNAIL